MKLRRVITGVWLEMAASAAPILAQTEHKVSDSRIEVGSWVFQAAYVPDASGGATTIANIFAFAKLGTVVDDNLVAVWYQKQVGGAWVSKSWITTDQGEVVESLKQELNIPDSEDWKFATTGVSFSGTPMPPEGYSGGLLTEDPLVEVVQNAPNPEEIVNLLASAGYKAASVATDVAGECGTDAQLDGIASEIVAMINSGDDMVLTTSSLDGICAAGTPRGPAPTRPAMPATPPAWSPPGTVPSVPGGWTPGGWPMNPGPPATPRWNCRTIPSTGTPGGNSTCRCTRIQRWGRWETHPDCSLRPGNQPCTRWREIEELETCSNTGPCPAGGGPGNQPDCRSSY